MTRKLVIGLHFLCVLFVLQLLVRAQDCKTDPQSQEGQQEQVAGFDNPLAADCFGMDCPPNFAIGYVVLGYLLGILIGIVRGCTGASWLRTIPTGVLNI